MKKQRGQALLIFAFAAVGLVASIGLAVDAGSLYAHYGQLKRAVDAAGITAANEFKSGQTLDKLEEAADEILVMHDIDMALVDLKVYICDAYETDDDHDLVEPYAGTADGTRDRYLAIVEPTFYARCPNTESGLQSARKLVWIEATQKAPLFFLSIIGFSDVPLTTHTITEAAPVDLVIVIDISESMGRDTTSFPFTIGDYDPANCNADNTCQPLRDAKDAALVLVDKMHFGYDRVAVVTFDINAETIPILNIQGVTTSLSDDMDEVKNAINGITLHDDAPYNRLWPKWRPELADPLGAQNFAAYNPVNPEDRDGDGFDADPAFPTCADEPLHPKCCVLDDDRWDDSQPARFAEFNYEGGGFPCDDDNLLDAYDWDLDGVYTAVDDLSSEAFLNNDRSANGLRGLSFLSTCTGCGIREASSVLSNYGRNGAVWIVVFLSDGAVNLSDSPLDPLPSVPYIPTQYTNGFCYGPRLDMNPSLSPVMFSYAWNIHCRDKTPGTRVCIDDDINTCPPGSIYENPATLLYGQISYSPYDYALDKVDDMALTVITGTSQEPLGHDIGIFSIGLGDVVKTNAMGVVTESYGEDLLRYMAAVGDDGDRDTDPCAGIAHKTSCGQYYYAPSGDELLPIFEEIASRIYTRISK